MKLTLNEERFEFNFPNAISLYKFDERDPLSTNFHGGILQAVDVMAVFPKFQLWIEIKEFLPNEIQKMMQEGNQMKKNDYVHNKTNLTKNLKHKFRDTYLYRYCENEVGSPIVYVCLTNFDDALNGFFKRELQKQIPSGILNKNKWQRELVTKDHVFVVNKESWERNLKTKFGSCKKF